MGLARNGALTACGGRWSFFRSVCAQKRSQLLQLGFQALLSRLLQLDELLSAILTF